MRADIYVNEWQPIATAPLDETHVLLYWPYWSKHAIVGVTWDAGARKRHCTTEATSQHIGCRYPIHQRNSNDLSHHPLRHLLLVQHRRAGGSMDSGGVKGSLKVALTVKLKQLPDHTSKHFDFWVGEGGLWEFEIQMPKGSKPTAADIHFEFEESEDAAKEKQ